MHLLLQVCDLSLRSGSTCPMRWCVPRSDLGTRIADMLQFTCVLATWVSQWLRQVKGNNHQAHIASLVVLAAKAATLAQHV